MTSFSFLACTNFLILLKFGFIPATFFFFLIEVLSWCSLLQKQLRVSSPRIPTSSRDRDGMSSLIFTSRSTKQLLFASKSPLYTVPHLKD